ncbi:hypothetical protein [Nocardia abscessus]|uniref:hypothetical protein n=1 Tax=Nocardia abscessus TaxID=120957 RepID=UPI002456C3B6|nr:hypothetical protein [Nocardia abscessus]
MQRFTELADQRDKAAGRDLDLRRTAVEDLVKPLFAQVEKVTGIMQAVERTEPTRVAAA